MLNLTTEDMPLTISTDRTREPRGEAKRKAALNATWDQRRKTVAGRIEDEVLALSLKKGLDAVTVDDIAAAAGISRRTFYRFFESPSDVVHVVLQRANDVWAQAFRERPLDEPILVSFHAAFAFVENSPDQVPNLGLALEIIRHSREAWSRVSGPSHASSTARFRTILVERMLATNEDPRPAGAIAAAIVAMMTYLGEQSPMANPRDNGEDFENAIKAFQRILDPVRVPLPSAGP